MIGAGNLLAATLALPLAMLLACLSPRLRARMPALLGLAPVPGLLAALFASDGEPLVLPQALYGATLALDVPGAMLLGAAALLWIAAGTFASTYLHAKPNAGDIAPWWLLALTGNLGVFMAADMASFYLFFAMASLSAYGLIAYDGSARARRAGAVYVGLALLGEACVLMGLVLLAAATPDGSLLIRDGVAALPASPWRPLTLALLLAGFGLKIGLVPFHVWMPLAYGAAPIPAAAALSGAAVKAGVIGLLRFMPFEAAEPVWGEALAAAGLVSAFYGVAVGITQPNPRTVLAYSSVSQMGLIAAIVGMGLAAGYSGVMTAASFYAAHHVLAKGALFLAIGVAATLGTRGPWPVFLPAAIVALGLAGLPLTGGALAKAAVKDTLGDGLVAGLAALAAVGSTVLMLHFLKCLSTMNSRSSAKTEPSRLTVPWLGMALAAIAAPWIVLPLVLPGALDDALSMGALWSALWPVAIGVMIAFGLHRWLRAIPSVPEGDIVVALDVAGRAAIAASAACGRIDASLRQWTVAGVSLLTLAVVLGAAFVAGR